MVDQGQTGAINGLTHIYDQGGLTIHQWNTAGPLPELILYLFFQRHIVSAVAGGGSK